VNCRLLWAGIPGSWGLPVSHTAEQQRQKLQAAVISQYSPIFPNISQVLFPGFSVTKKDHPF